MPEFNWQSFLKQWSDAIIASGVFSQVLRPEAVKENWAGFPPASEQAIAKAERRLGLRLPKSYREFLKLSNGWLLEVTQGPTRLWSVEEIRPMAEIDPDGIRLWTEFGDYTSVEDDPTDLPNSHLSSVIQISEDNDGFYLLNPLIEPLPGEWQAAFFANWVPGAECHASFQDMMFDLGETFLAAHPVVNTSGGATVKNLRNPPGHFIEDPREFIDELQRLGYFRFVSSATAERMCRDFQTTHAEWRRSGCNVVLDAPFPFPGSVLLGEDSGRVVDLAVARLAESRAGYAIAKFRPLLGAAGIELAAVEETTTADSYSVALEGVERRYFRMRNGNPMTQGGEHQSNAAQEVLNETVKLLNAVLKARGCDERVASLLGVQNSNWRETRLGLVLLDDDLSCLLASPLLGYGFRVMRPDII